MKKSEQQSQLTKSNTSNKIKDVHAKNADILSKAKKLRDKMFIKDDILDVCQKRLIAGGRASKEDNRRSEVVARLPNLSKRLSGDNVPNTCASFRFHRSVREVIVPIVSAMFRDDDVPVAKVMMKRRNSSPLQ